MRRAGLGFAVLALVLAAWVAGRRLVAPAARELPRPTAVPPRGSVGDRLADPGTVEPPGGSRSPLVDDEPAGAGPADSARDLAAALAQLARLLETDPLFVRQVWDPRCAALARELGTADAAWLVEAASDANRPAAERIAALAVLGAARPRPQGVSIAPSARRLLQQGFDVRLPAPVPAASAVEPPGFGALSNQRASLARVCGAVLATVGDADDLARLVGALDDAELAGFASESLARAGASVALPLLAERVADATREATGAANALAGILAREEATALDPELARRAAEGLLARWEHALLLSAEALACERALAGLDPQRAAERWGALVDAGALPEAALLRAASALARSEAPAAAARLAELLASPREVARLAAAEATLREPSGVPARQELRLRAGRALREIALSSSDPLARRRALLTLGPGPEATLELLERVLAGEPDERVREAAVLCLAPRPELDGAAALLERAAGGDASPRVRRLAAQALRGRN